jgi:hypothetical protein
LPPPRAHQCVQPHQFCLQFRDGWWGAFHSNRTRCYPRAPALSSINWLLRLGAAWSQQATCSFFSAERVAPYAVIPPFQSPSVGARPTRRAVRE